MEKLKSNSVEPLNVTDLSKQGSTLSNGTQAKNAQRNDGGNNLDWSQARVNGTVVRTNGGIHHNVR